jgi:Methyltransferase domain
MVASAAQSGPAFLGQYHRQRPLDLDDDRFVKLHEGFLRELSTIGSLADHLNEAERANYAAICSRCHKRYLAIKEARANKNLLAVARNGGTSIGGNRSEFARSPYPPTAGRMAVNPTFNPSSSLRTLLDFRDCKNVVMIGCGAFPATLLWLRDNFPTLRYVGLDIDPDCVEMATELVAALGIDNVHFESIDGRQYDYSGADFVYVANYVTPKRAVLEQIARSTSVRRVVVREPTRGGELLAEAVRFDLPSVFVADAAGAEVGIMMYDLLLRRVQPEAIKRKREPENGFCS